MDICKKFYHHLCDFFLETLKILTISKKSLLKHCQFTPQAYDVFSRFANQNKSVLMVMGHNGNWEWSCNAFNMLSQHQLFVIYHPISNKYFDGLMHHIRSRYGTKLIAMKNTYREMAANKNGLNATAFVADQTPQPDHAYWTTFLNQDTPVFKGMEVIAKKMNLPVLYTSVKKIKRGYYEMNAEVLASNPTDTADGELSEMYIRRLEKDIIAQPETWLWSHRRWKHKRTQPSLHKA
jgi:Kdo2-lipid IVA lauroyltransferase/acyltransferase